MTRIRVVTWNMGCGPPFVRYNKTHADAWRHLIDELEPDIALVQEARLAEGDRAAGPGHMVWSTDQLAHGGAGVFTREGIVVRDLTIEAGANFFAAAEITLGAAVYLVASAHVGPGNYRRNLEALRSLLAERLQGRRFIIGGDLNAARGLDASRGGRWYERYFASLTSLGLHDCHFEATGHEAQTFWGHQAKGATYQLDHLFTDLASGAGVTACRVVDNDVVRVLSDHGPVLLEIAL